MSEQHFQAEDIKIDNDAKTVNIVWADQHQSHIPITRLRGYCPCAECQGHGGPISWIENDIHGILNVEMVGRYALMITFADQHSTGIYRWEYLRRLDPSEQERWGQPETFSRVV